MGVPDAVVWSAVSCRDNANVAITCDAQEYKVKYVIDRLCERQTSGSTTITDVQGYCFVDIGSGKGGSKGAFQAVFTSASAVYYRITVQVTGPRNSTAYVQAIVTKS